MGCAERIWAGQELDRQENWCHFYFAYMWTKPPISPTPALYCALWGTYAK